MRLRWLGLCVALPFMGGCSLGGIEKINVYKLLVNGAPLFSPMDRFINVMGLPETVQVGIDQTYTVERVEDIITIVEDHKEDPYGVTLHYQGIEMDVWNNKDLVPTAVDFRESDSSITYKNMLWDKTFTLDQFKKHFPRSYALSERGLFDQVRSLFETKTGESGPQYRQYMLERGLKTGIFATTTVEFTFEDDALIYIFFANWG